MTRVLLVITVLAWLGGCVSSASGPLFRPEIVDESRSVLYVFRDGGGPARIEVTVDQAPAGAVERGGYIAVVTSAGRHLVAAGAGGAQVREVVVGRGESVYLRISDGPFRSTRLDVLETAQGRAQIAGAHKSE